MPIAPFKLERFFVPYEHTTRYLLGSSDCQAMSIGELLALEPAAAEQFHQTWLGYTEYEGDPALRDEIATHYTQIAPNQVLVYSGAEEAIFGFMQALLNAGDHLVVHMPSYQSLYEVARGVGCQVSEWMADEPNGWALDLNALRDLIQPNTRAVVINCPHNPTGYLMSAEDQAALVTLLRERGILLFSDEVYRGLEHDPADRLPAACDVYENAVSLGVMSKAYGLAGLRIGWIATRNRQLFEALAAFKDYTSICNSAPSEFLATLALRQRAHLLARNLGIIHANLALLDAFFTDYAEQFVWQRPKAGVIAFPRIRFEADIEAFCVDLIRVQGVMLLPGTCFFYGNQHFRMGFGRTNMPEALTQFQAYLHAKGIAP
ncbi:MAG: aminotransferase class I/II-fold pyridoxal phosphate-dependent enzyme [Phototrophicaceae bacterium]